MVLVAVAFVVGALFGAILTATLVARGQRMLGTIDGGDLNPSDFERPMRPADQWLAERNDRREPTDPLDAIADQRIGRFHDELAKRLGRDAATTARERRTALTRALRPGFGIVVRVRK